MHLIGLVKIVWWEAWAIRYNKDIAYENTDIKNAP